MGPPCEVSESSRTTGAATLSVARVLDQARRRAFPLALPAQQHLFARAPAALGDRLERIEEAPLVALTPRSIADADETVTRDRDQLAREREHPAARHLRREATP